MTPAQANRQRLARRAVDELTKFIDGIDEVIKPSAKGVALEACKGALHFHLALITEALDGCKP